MKMALSVWRNFATHAIETPNKHSTLVCVYFRCKGFLEICLKPEFKLFRLGISYYTAYFQFPVSNASETASIFLTMLLSIERYQAMHQISFPNQQRRFGCSLRWLFFCKVKTDRSREHSVLSRVKRCLLFPAKCCTSFQSNVRATVVKVIIVSIAINIPMFFSQQIIMNYPENYTNTQDGTLLVKWRVDVTDFGKSRGYAMYTGLRTVFVQILPLIFLCIINFYLIQLIRMVNARWRNILSHRLGPQAYLGNAQTIDTEELSICPELPQSKGWEPIAITLNKSAWQTARRQAAQRKLTVLLVAIVCLFLAGQIPQALAFASNYQIILRLFNKSSNSLACSPHYRLYRVITHCLCLITYSANFILYATLNRHFKGELQRWFCPCAVKCYAKPEASENYTDNPLNSIPFTRDGKALKVSPLKDPVSADFVQLRKGSLQMAISSGPVSDVLPAGLSAQSLTERGNHRTVYSHSDHVWRATIAVLSHKGGRPLTLANATLDRSITTTLSRSTSKINDLNCEKSSLTVSSCMSERLAKSFDHDILINQTREDLSSNLDEDVIFRVQGHSKRFWSKRRKTLVDEVRRPRMRDLPRGLSVQSHASTAKVDRRYRIQVVSRVMRPGETRKGDLHTIQLSLPPELSSKAWCPPFIVASMLRANINSQKSKRNLTGNTFPIIYQETDLNNTF